MKLSVKNTNYCLHCGKRLSMFHLFLDLLYCSRSHKSAHLSQINKLALARLVETERSPSRTGWEPVERPLTQAEVVSAS